MLWGASYIIDAKRHTATNIHQVEAGFYVCNHYIAIRAGFLNNLKFNKSPRNWIISQLNIPQKHHQNYLNLYVLEWVVFSSHSPYARTIWLEQLLTMKVIRDRHGNLID